MIALIGISILIIAAIAAVIQDVTSYLGEIISDELGGTK